MEHGWSLDVRVWDVLSGTLQHEKPQWNVSGLRPNGGASIPEQPGIYMLCVRPLTKKNMFVMDAGGGDVKELYNPLYIGESENLNIRYGEYAKMKSRRPRVKTFLAAFRGKIDFCYWVLADADKKKLVMVQNLLIWGFKPSANTQGIRNVFSGFVLKSVPAYPTR